MSHKVIIDGVIYTPETEDQKEIKELLLSVYGTLWANAHYDPYSKEIEKFAKPLSDKMSRLNEIMKFKE